MGEPAPFLFGQGMTYTNFNFSVSVESKNKFIVAVSNVGSVAAQQTVLLFSRPLSVPEAPLPLPNRQLFDFGRTETLAPGKSMELEFTVSNEDVALVDWAGSRKAYSGT